MIIDYNSIYIIYDCNKNIIFKMVDIFILFLYIIIKYLYKILIIIK